MQIPKGFGKVLVLLLVLTIFLASVGILLQQFLMPSLPNEWQTIAAIVLAAFLASVLLLSAVAQLTGYSLKDFLHLDGKTHSSAHTATKAPYVIPPPKEMPVLPRPIEVSDLHYAPIPTPKEIMIAFEQAPPFQRMDLAKNYIGLRVDWQVQLSDVSKGWSRDCIELDLVPLGETFPDILCEVRASEYPRVKILKRDDRLEILGTISDAKTTRIQLSDCLLKFDESKVLPH